jgi:RimJ/RimL family protein N-acetyltransferase
VHNRAHQPDRPLSVTLRPLAAADIPTLFEHQCDPEASRMAVVTPRTREAFEELWNRLLTTPPPRLAARAIEADGVLVGMINCFQRTPSEEEASLMGVAREELDYVGYWLGREHWGRGIGGRCLAALLREVDRRPLYARAASTNTASLRILHANGFVTVAKYNSPPGDPRFPPCEEHLLILK